MIRRPPSATRTDTLFPYTTLFRSRLARPVIPAKAGIHGHLRLPWRRRCSWAPACAGATNGERAELSPLVADGPPARGGDERGRSEEHTSELQSLMRISYAVVCLKTKNTKKHHDKQHSNTPDR